MFVLPYTQDMLFNFFKWDPLDDSVDRLGYLWAARILFFFCCLVSGKQYVGSPIECWMPARFAAGWKEYSQDFCFIQDTYYLPLSEEFPEDRGQAEVSYYKWVPVVLAIQGILFWIPSMVWKTMRWRSVLDVDTVMEHALIMKSLEPEKRQEKSTDIVRMFSGPIKDCFRTGRSVRLLTFSYILFKLLNLVNIFLQIYLLNEFLGSDNTMWGLQTLLDMMSGREWTEPALFPRVTLCDFEVRVLANVQKHTVQCVLPINMFNEKIFLFIWFFLVFVLSATFINVIYSIVTTLSPHFRRATIARIIKDYIRSSTANIPVKQQVAEFTERATTSDLVLLFVFLERNAGPLIAKEIASTMWNDFQIDEENRQRADYLEEIERNKKDL